MSDLSDYMENAICNVFRGTTLTAPASIFVALFSTMPGEDGAGGVENPPTIRPGGRVAVPFGAPTTSGAGRQVANSSDVDFGNAAGAASVVGFGLYDAASGGNLLALKAFGSPISVASGANFKSPAGSLTFTAS